MAKIEITTLETVNGLKFGATSAQIHKTFGNNYTKNDNKPYSEKDDEFLLEIAKKFSEMTGKPIENYTKYLDNKEYDFDDTTSSDFYTFAKIEYDENNCFEAIEIYSDQKIDLIINGENYSDFNLQKLLTLADDFVSEENNTSYTSYSKQIGIWCPDGDDRVECILFGRAGYYDNLDE